MKEAGMGVISRIALYVVLAVIGTGGQADAAGPNQKLKVGVTLDVPGMNHKNPKTGAIDGFEPDLARAIATQLPGGPDAIDFVQVSDKQRIASVQNHELDMVIAQVTITPERAAKVAFSVPYYVTHEGLLVPKGSSIKRLEDLAGKRIAVTASSDSLKNLRAQLPSLPGATLVIAPSTKGTFEEVEKGTADAAVSDFINLELWRRASGKSDLYELIDLSGKFKSKPWAIAVAKDNHSLLDRLNTSIESLKSRGDIEKLLNEAIAKVGPN